MFCQILLIIIISCFGHTVTVNGSPCSNGVITFFRTSNVKPQSWLTYELTSTTLNAAVCFERCSRNVTCAGYFVNNDGSECLLVPSQLSNSVRKHYEFNLNWNFHQKLCLYNISNCHRHWTFERMPSYQLFDRDEILVSRIFTEEHCMRTCVEHKQFVCRSARFDKSRKQCTLSKYDRHTASETFKKISNSHISYLENQCVSDQFECKFDIEYEPINKHYYSEYDAHTKDICEKYCSTELDFNCRSFIYDEKMMKCFLSPDYRKSDELQIKTKAKARKFTLTNATIDHRQHYEKTKCNQDCDERNIHFELITGLSTLKIYNRDHKYKPYKIINDFQPQHCIKICRNDYLCKAINVNFKRSLCELYSHQLDFKLINLTSDAGEERNDGNYYEKICLNKQINNCSARDWLIERIPGKELISLQSSSSLSSSTSSSSSSSQSTENKIIKVKTRLDCMQACIDNSVFQCRSAEYLSDKNLCRLSNHNRFTFGDKQIKLQSANNVDYMENNCIREPRGFCNWKASRETYALVDRYMITDNVSVCEKYCFESENFVCRSLMYDEGSRICSLSHHTKLTYPDESYRRSSPILYHEISSCFDVGVTCEPDIMRVTIESNKNFQGKVYAKDRPDKCSLDIGNSMQFSLPINLTGTQCGTILEDEGKFSNVLVIQSNDNVMTAFDKAIGIKCAYDVGNRTGVTALHLKEIRLTDRSRSSPQLPDLSLHITDLMGYEREVVNLGELLRVQVRMSDEGTYGIFIRNMIAKDETGNNNLTLIDQSGCPVEAKMMREVRTIDQQSKSLESYFEAFSFTGSNTIKLETDVETCLGKCRPVQCHLISGRSDDGIETVTSYGRKRRDLTGGEKLANGDIIETTHLTKRLSIKSKQFDIYGEESVDGNQIITSSSSKSSVSPAARRQSSLSSSSLSSSSSASSSLPLSSLSSSSSSPSSSLSSSSLSSNSDSSKIVNLTSDNKHKTNNSYMVSASIRSMFNISVDDLGYYCFEPTTLATFSGATLLIQVTLMVIVVMMATRIKK